MSITLAEAKVGMTNKVDQMVIDEFRRSSILLDRLIFDDTISPATGGSTLGYSYIRLKSPSSVAVRKINEEYAPSHAVREKVDTEAIILGGSFEIDRVIAQTSGAINEVNFQLSEKVTAACNYFNYLVVNGCKATSGTGYATGTFDGLKKILSGTDTELTTDIDISSSDLLDTNYNRLIDELDEFLSNLDGKPDFLLMNSKMKTKVAGAARRAGYYRSDKTAFGDNVDMYNGIILLDAGKYYDANKKKSIDSVATEADGTSAIYAAKIGLDGFHGISVDGSKMVSTHLPNFNDAGSVKKGDAELIAGVALKNSQKAGVLKGIKIAAGSSLS